MTDAEISNMTIGEVELLASRLRVALQTLQDARAVLSGGAATELPAVRVPSTASRAHAMLSPLEQAQRDALLAANRAQRDAEVLPEDVKRLEGIS